MKREKVNQMKQALLHWEELEEEIDNISTELEDEGWDTFILNPGDITAVPSGGDEDDPEFYLIVPDSEVNHLGQFISGNTGDFDRFTVYRREESDILLFAVVMMADTAKQAIIYPTYYDPETDVEFLTAAQNTDALYTRVSDLGETKQFLFRLSRPGLFVPE